MKLTIFAFAVLASIRCFAIDEPVITDTTHPRATLAPLSGIQGFSKDVRVYVREDGQQYTLTTNSKVVLYYGTNLTSIYVGVATNTSVDTNTGSALIETAPLASGNMSYALAIIESGRTNDLGTGLLTVKASSFGGAFYPLPGQTIDWSTMTWTGSNQPVKSGSATINGVALTNGSVFTISAGGAVTSVFARTGAVVAATGDYTAAQVGAVSTNDTRYLAAVTNETDPKWQSESSLYYRVENTSSYVTASVTNTHAGLTLDAHGIGSYSNYVDVTYLKSYTETDPIWGTVSNLNYANWNTATGKANTAIQKDGSVAWSGNDNHGGQSITNVGSNIQGIQNTFNFYTLNGGQGGIAVDNGAGTFYSYCMGNTVFSWSYVNGFSLATNLNMAGYDVTNLNGYASITQSLNQVGLNIGNASNNASQAILNSTYNSNSIVTLGYARDWASNGVVSASGQVAQALANTLFNSNNMHNASALTNSIYGVSLNYAIATNGTAFSNSIAWVYAPKAGTITNIIAESVEGTVRAGLWVRSNGVAQTANSYIAYTNIPAVQGTSSNIIMTVPYNAGVFLGVPVTNGAGTNVTFTIVGVE